MRQHVYAIVEAIPVVQFDGATRQHLTTEEFQRLVYRWVVSNAALYRYAMVVGGVPNPN